MHRSHGITLIAFSTFLFVAILLLAITAFGQGQPGTQPAAQWFSRPSELPKDVFDLPEFDSYRTGGKLDVDRAEAYLES